MMSIDDNDNDFKKTQLLLQWITDEHDVENFCKKVQFL